MQREKRVELHYLRRHKRSAEGKKKKRSRASSAREKGEKKKKKRLAIDKNRKAAANAERGKREGGSRFLAGRERGRGKGHQGEKKKKKKKLIRLPVRGRRTVSSREKREGERLSPRSASRRARRKKKKRGAPIFAYLRGGKKKKKRSSSPTTAARGSEKKECHRQEKKEKNFPLNAGERKEGRYLQDEKKKRKGKRGGLLPLREGDGGFTGEKSKGASEKKKKGKGFFVRRGGEEEEEEGTRDLTDGKNTSYQGGKKGFFHDLREKRKEGSALKFYTRGENN